MPASRESTVTCGRRTPIHREASRTRGGFVRVNGNQSVRVNGTHNTRGSIREPETGNRLIVAVDFGTTYSAVSYVAIPRGLSPEFVDSYSIESIKNYSEAWSFRAEGQVIAEVPTEVIYPLNNRFRRQDVANTTDTNAVDSSTEEEAPLDFHPISSINGTANNEDPYGICRDNRGALNSSDDHFRWGYQVHDLWCLPATHSDTQNQPLSRFKLLLDNHDVTKSIREKVQHTVEALKERKVVKNHLSVISDFLTYLLKHAEGELQKQGFNASFRREIVLCVPAIWSQQACRHMQICMATAMERAQFSGVDLQNNSIENLFIVSEPEAAAAYMLTDSNSVDCGEVFVLLDAGGGTVDANTYRVSHGNPLRLSEEIVEPAGGLCGSSFLNERFGKYLRQRLAHETYLERGPETINGIVESILMNHFEHKLKRNFDIYDNVNENRRFAVSGLRDSVAKGFAHGYISVPVEHIREIFLQCFEEISTIMENQIRAAWEGNHEVHKVVLIGGFASSNSLQKFLETRIHQMNRQHGSQISLYSPRMGAPNAVASGAVLRALNKEHGPSRKARSSYGILRTEPYGEYPEHDEQKPTKDPHDGQYYIVNTIDWVLKRGQTVDPVWECKPFASSHTFNVWPTRPLLCREVLFVSDTAEKSHYKKKHANNEGAEQIGEIVVDASFLRDQGSLVPIEPTRDDRGNMVGKRHYKVSYTIVIRVVDRDLECYAIFDGTVQKKCRINIASGFPPGAR